MGFVILEGPEKAACAAAGGARCRFRGRFVGWGRAKVTSGPSNHLARWNKLATVTKVCRTRGPLEAVDENM